MADFHPGIVFLLIVAAVPLQLYLSPPATSHVKYRLQRLMDSVIWLTDKLGVPLPHTELRTTVPLDTETGLPVTEGDVPYMGLSHVTRERSPDVVFRVGQVVYHKSLQYKAVIVGWDLEAKLPADRWEKMRKEPGFEAWLRSVPKFAILVDGRNKLVPSLAYVGQNLLKLSSGRIIHPTISHYFEKYDEKTERYVLRPWLRKVYPDD